MIVMMTIMIFYSPGSTPRRKDDRPFPEEDRWTIMIIIDIIDIDIIDVIDINYY